MKTLETERLILRPWCEDDADDMFQWAKSPNVGPRAGWPPHENIEKSQSIIKHFIAKDDVWAIVLKEAGKPIGSFGLHNDEKRNNPNARCLGYVLSEDYWGKDIIAEATKEVLRFAFEEQDLTLVSVCHYDFNEQSKRVIEKCGFTYEGTLRQAVKLSFANKPYDELCYSMTRAEWEIIEK